MKYLLLMLLLLPSSVLANDFTKKHGKVIDAIIKAADLADVPRDLLLGICWVESNYHTTGVTHLDGDTISHGICQIKYETAAFLRKYYKLKTKLTTDRLNKPFYNALFSAYYVKSLLERYDDNWILVAAAYNAGQGRVDSWVRRYSTKDMTKFIRKIPFKVTKQYAKRILKVIEFINRSIDKSKLYTPPKTLA